MPFECHRTAVTAVCSGDVERAVAAATRRGSWRGSTGSYVMTLYMLFAGEPGAVAEINGLFATSPTRAQDTAGSETGGLR